MQVSKHNLFFDTPEPGSKIIMNLLGGSMDLLDEEMYRFLTDMGKKGDIPVTEETGTLLKACYERGYLVNSVEEEDKKLEVLWREWEDGISKRAESITIYPTFTCNLRCVYCFECENLKKKKDIMSLKTLNHMMQAIDVIHESHDSHGTPMVTIFGGEPLLKRPKQLELIEEILKGLKKRDFQVGVITNGVDLPHYCGMLSKYGVDLVEVTIDGPKQIHDQRRIFPGGRGSFDKVVAGIDAALAENIHTVVRVHVDQQNINSLPDLADFIMDKSWLDQGIGLDMYALDAAGSECETSCRMAGTEMLSKVFQIFDTCEKTRIFNLVNRAVRFIEGLLHHRRLPFPQIAFCGATAGNKYSFDLYGKIFPCCCMNCCDLDEFNQGEFHPELTFHEGIINKWRKRNVLHLSQCRECPEALLCGSGCTRIALMCGEGLEDGVFCPSIREEFQTALVYYYPMLRGKLLSPDDV